MVRHCVRTRQSRPTVDLCGMSCIWHCRSLRGPGHDVVGTSGRRAYAAACRLWPYRRSRRVRRARRRDGRDCVVGGGPRREQTDGLPVRGFVHLGEELRGRGRGLGQLPPAGREVERGTVGRGQPAAAQRSGRLRARRGLLRLGEELHRSRQLLLQLPQRPHVPDARRILERAVMDADPAARSLWRLRVRPGQPIVRHGRELRPDRRLHPRQRPHGCLRRGAERRQVEGLQTARGR